MARSCYPARTLREQVMTGLDLHIADLVHISVNASYCHWDFLQPLRCVSNAPWLGGFTDNALGLLNLKVNKTAELNLETGEPEPLETTFQRHMEQLQLKAPCLGMMTAASMNSFRYHHQTTGEYQVICGVTAGLANARRVGDRADDNAIHTIRPPAGTINVALITNAPLTPSAQQEAFALICEAKTAACYDKHILSKKSQQMATGTGTDATLIACKADEPIAIPYCGKHTLLGERIGACAYHAVAQSLQACLDED